MLPAGDAGDNYILVAGWKDEFWVRLSRQMHKKGAFNAKVLPV
jgi:hypothetical protein